jgi:hypothetical protein
MTGQVPPNGYPSMARFPLTRMQPLLRSFWSAYANAIQDEAAKTDDWLLGAVEWAAVRLLQTALEASQFATQMTGSVVLHVQLSKNMLGRPREAAVHLLGLHPGWAIGK